MNVKKGKARFLALATCLLSASLYYIPNVNAALHGTDNPQSGKDETSNLNSNTDSSQDSLEDIFIERNPSVTDSDRKSSSFFVPQAQCPLEEDSFQQVTEDKTEDFISDELKTPLDIPKNIEIKDRDGNPILISSTAIPGTEITVQSPTEITVQRPKNTLVSGFTVSGDCVNYGVKFIRQPMIISGPERDPDNRVKVRFEWLTISGVTPVVFKNLDISGKIHATAKSNIIFENCNIHNDLPLDKTECAVEIFAGSRAKFENCFLDSDPSQRVCVVVSDYGSRVVRNGIRTWRAPNTPITAASFEKCKFGKHQIGVFAMKGADVQLLDCTFSECNNISVFLTKGTDAFIKNCKFVDMPGKAIFLKDDSSVKIDSCEFIRCDKGAITGAEHSNAKLINCQIREPKNTSVRFIEGCKANVIDCYIDTVDGNCINMESSDGTIKGCKIYNKSPHPSIAAIGKECCPVIENCYLEQLKASSYTIVVKDSSHPVFKRNVIKVGANGIALSCSNLAHPTFEGNSFEIVNSNEIPELRVIGGAKPKFILNKDKSDYKEEDEIDFSLADPKNYVKVVEKTHGAAVFLVNNEDKDIECSAILQNDDNESKLMYDKLDKVLGIKYDEEFYEKIDDMCHVKSDSDDKIIPFIKKCGHAIHKCPICGSKSINFNTVTGALECEDCNTDFSQSPFRCTICNFLVKGKEDIGRLFEEDKCVICYDRPATNIVLPCGHKCMCFECASRCKMEGFNCPMCNGTITSCAMDFACSDDND